MNGLHCSCPDNGIVAGCPVHGDRLRGWDERRPETKQVLELSQTVMFLARRLAGRAGHKGISSDALIAAAATRVPVPEDVYPHDCGDFGRCCEAYALAPAHLRLRMLPQLVAWGQKLVEMEADRGW